jgi:hypothetical protein
MQGDNWRVVNCSILKIGRIGITVFGGNNWSIERNHFTKTIPAQTMNEAILVTKQGETRATNARIIDNICEGSGIMFWGFSLYDRPQSGQQYRVRVRHIHRTSRQLPHDENNRKHL